MCYPLGHEHDDVKHLILLCIHLVDDKTSQTGDVRHLTVHCVHLVDDETGRTDDVRHLTIYVHLVNDETGQTDEVIEFIWWMTKPVRLVMSGI